MSNKQKHLAPPPPPSLIGLMSVGEGSRDEGISLCVKFKTSRMLSSAIFWWGCCCCSCSCSCDRGKTKLTPSPKAEAWTLDWSLTILKQT